MRKYETFTPPIRRNTVQLYKILTTKKHHILSNQPLLALSH